jgi:hypothetical protein
MRALGIARHGKQTPLRNGGRMYPWLWFWAPQVYWPWSGDVVQRIQPDTNWFFRGIPPGAGDAAIEEKAFAVASYGTQLGLITDVLIDLAARLGTESGDAGAALERLKRIRDAIERIKTSERGHRASDIADRVAEMRRKGGDAYAELSRRLLPLLQPPGV